jgi:hypothetical protein
LGRAVSVCIDAWEASKARADCAFQGLAVAGHVFALVVPANAGPEIATSAISDAASARFFFVMTLFLALSYAPWREMHIAA